MTHRLAACAVLTLLGHAVAQDRPARLRLRPPPPTARGLAPEAGRPATWADSPADVVRPLTEAEARLLTPAPPSGPILDLSRLRSTLFGQPVSVTQPASVSSYSAESLPEPAAPTIYARGPAYRWYGWGAMPPGREAAPAKPSEAWLSQTGATPGAFPAGTVAAAPEIAPPVTPAPTAKPTAMVPTELPMSAPPNTGFDANQPISMTNLPPLPPGAVLVDANVPPGPPPMVGVPMTPVSPVVPASGATPPPLSGPPQAWRPVAPTVTPAVVQASATVPDFTPPLERAVRDATKGVATVTAVRFPAPGRMAVALRCKSVAEANAATKAISALPAVTPLAVEFAVELE